MSWSSLSSLEVWWLVWIGLVYMAKRFFRCISSTLVDWAAVSGGCVKRIRNLVHSGILRRNWHFGRAYTRANDELCANSTDVREGTRRTGLVILPIWFLKPLYFSLWKWINVGASKQVSRRDTIEVFVWSFKRKIDSISFEFVQSSLFGASTSRIILGRSTSDEGIRRRRDELVLLAVVVCQDLLS